MLADLVEFLTQLVQQIVVSFGAPGIGLVALMENLFPPIPSEALYPLAGKMAFDGQISLLAIIVAGTLGSLVGGLIWYSIGYRLGEARTRELIARYGVIRLARLKLKIVSVEDYDRALGLYRKHGGVIVFVGRLMPLVHGVVAIPAGVVRMNLFRFILYTILGAAGWIAPLSIFGYWLGSNWQEILRWLDVYEYVWYALIAAAVVGYVIYRIRAGRVSRKADASAD